MLQFTFVPNFTYQINSFIIIRSRNLKQTFVLPPSCSLSFSKYGTLTRVSLFPTTYYRSELQYLQVNIAHTSSIRASSMFLLLSVGNFNLSGWCTLKNIKTDILGFGKPGRMVQMYKCKRQTNKDTRTPYWYNILYFRILFFPARQTLAPCLSMLSVCPLASSI
jgi:hypothetical protein